MKWLGALLLTGCLILAGCGGDDGDTTSDAAGETPAEETTTEPATDAPTEEATTEAPSDDAVRLEEEAKPSYISSCKAGGAPASVCECAWDGLTEAYTPEELIDLFESAGTGETPTELLEKQEEIVKECVG